jgi:acyl CoA:acetate/3-ketoacid CoA transferase alpha subunit
MLSFVDTVADAVAGIKDGSTVMIGGFGNAGQPFELIDALLDCGATRADRGEQQRRPERSGPRAAD